MSSYRSIISSKNIFLIQCDLNYDIIHALMIPIIDEMESFVHSMVSFTSSLFSKINTYICNRLESFYFPFLSIFWLIHIKLRRENCKKYIYKRKRKSEFFFVISRMKQPIMTREVEE